ncbi:MAG: extracellular solute-binding protein [Deltaproteobacteria bacterium]|nr:extracellular solute-binding protein [Deltaproteobacteria bacterium]
MKAKSIKVILALLVILAGETEAPAEKADESLQRLIEAARREGQLDVMITSSMGQKGATDLIAAFKRRTGLDITINADLSGQESQKFNRAVAETKSGIPPTFDLMQGEPPAVLELIHAGGIERIENWEPLLSQIAPEAYQIKDKVSPSAIAGYGFLWATRISGLLYNPKLISARDLPKTWKEMGNPKYKGMFSIPPWTTITLMGLIKYDKDEWLETVRSWGRNKPQILTYSAGIERMLLGDLKFLEANDYYQYEHKTKDPNAPIGLMYFEDFTPLRQCTYVLRKGARHPNAGKLFALWATSAEANAIFEKHAYQTNVALARGPVSKQVTKVWTERKVKPVSWFDNPQTLEKYSWLGTDEGRKYSQAIARGQREGR